MSTTLNRPNQQRTGNRSLATELQRLFGYDTFKGKQEEVISQVMAGVDTVAIMPTGAGKSLCYQLPAMLLPGVTLVISPLIALMKDQYDSLPGEVYGRTTFINSTLDAEQLAARMVEIIAGKYKLVYCAPERLRQQPFVAALRRAQISLLVVDEAHCVSMWGHDFRPDYLFIGKVLPHMGHPTLLALTATATPQVREEIANQLGRKLQPVVASVFRPNLYYAVEEIADKEAKLRRLVEICKAEKGQSVVYARSREACEQLAAMLRRSGVSASHYHAGMDPDERTRAQENFMLDRVRVVVATIAFGMGIDKSNVRLIVHFSPPDTLEGYVQESGRAGRDGRPARCVLFISPGDKSNLTRWKRQEQIKLDELRAIYKELARLLPVGKTDYVTIDALGSQASAAAGKEIDGTLVRVAVSLLERVGLILRHADAPRNVTLTLTPEGAASRDPQFLALLEAAHLPAGQPSRRDVGVLCSALETAPSELEMLLLDWAEAGWIEYRGDRRDPVLQRLQPPAGLADLINDMLERRDRMQQRQIGQIVEYATAERCRHRILAAHLGEQIGDCETNCDWCAPPEARPQPLEKEAPPLPDNPGRVIVECLASFPFNVGKPSLVKALTGSAASNVKADRVRHFGTLAAASGAAIERAIDELEAGGYIASYESDGFRLLRVTEEGFDGVPQDAVALTAKKRKEPKRRETQEKVERQERQERSGRQEPSSTRRTEPTSRFTPQPSELELPPTPEEADLFERLRAWRKVVANRLNLPPYVIFHDKTLWAIARARPATPEELLTLRGVGQSHLDKYGPDILELIGQEEE